MNSYSMRLDLHKRHSIADSFVIVSLPFSYYLSQFNSFIPGVTLGELVLLISALIIIIYKKSKLTIASTKNILMFFLVAITFSVISISIAHSTFPFASMFDIVTRWIRYFAYVFLYIVFCDNFDNGDSMIDVYKVICFIMAVYAILQFLLYFFFRVYLPVNVFGLPISRDVSIETLIDSAEKSSFFRAKGMFVEPGYLAKFIIPGFYLSLFDLKENKRNILKTVILGTSVLMSGSVQGILMMIISVLLFFSLNRKLTINQLIMLIVFLFIVGVGLFMIINNGLLSRPIQRIINLLSRDSMDRSTQLRVFRGFAFWLQLPIEFKLLGVGLGNVANFAEDYDIYTIYDHYNRTESTLGYMNGISSILVSGGIASFLLFLRIFNNIRGKLTKTGFMLVLLFAFSLLGGGAFLSILGVLYFSLALACGEKI